MQKRRQVSGLSDVQNTYELPLTSKLTVVVNSAGDRNKNCYLRLREVER